MQNDYMRVDKQNTTCFISFDTCYSYDFQELIKVF